MQWEKKTRLLLCIAGVLNDEYPEVGGPPGLQGDGGHQGEEEEAHHRQRRQENQRAPRLGEC